MEKALIKWLRERYGMPDFVKIGIGDDCAVLPKNNAELIVTCDAICEGVHFCSSELSPQQIGRKALAVNLSDLASMGAIAKTVLVSLTLPRSRSLEYARQLFVGMEPLADRYGIEICGGDTNTWDGGLHVVVTAIGEAPCNGAWLVSGARPGDQIVVTGSFGGSILGRHWNFEPRLDFATQWREEKDIIHACTDVSDSLGIDLAKMAKASGVGFEIEPDSIPVAEDAEKLATESGRSALEHALSDGEDFELIIAVHPDSLADLIGQTDYLQLTRIGEFTASPKMLAKRGEEIQPFDPVGYEHRVEGPDRD